MAQLFASSLVPGKLDLVRGWAPTRPWWPTSASDRLEKVGAFRWDDPEGEVGVEVLLVRADDGVVLQVPLTYRGAPLAGAEEHLVGTMEHSVLGRRWVHDGCGDPAWARAVAAAALADAPQAEEHLRHADGREELRAPSVVVLGGTASTTATEVPAVGALVLEDRDDRTLVRTDGLHVEVRRVLDLAGPLADHVPAGARTIRVVWLGQESPVTLAVVTTP